MWWILRQFCTCLDRGKEAPLLPEEGSGGGPDFGFAVAKNERRRMEDAVDVKEDVAGFRLFVVYDGHAGDEAVSAVKRNFPKVLATHLHGEMDVEQAIRSDSKVAPLRKRPKHC